MTEKDEESVNGLLSELHHVLRTKRRREVIRILHETAEVTLTVRTLAREIAAAEHELPVTHATGEPYRNAYNALSQTHLPTLADAGIVIYDPKRQRVSKGQNFTVAALLAEIDFAAVRLIQKEQSEQEDAGNG